MLMILVILQVLVLVHPEWIGSDQGGHFGLYDYCISTVSSECQWSILRIRPISTAFYIAAGLVFAATILSAVALFSILLLVLIRDHYVFLICSWMHLFSGMAMLAGCLVYPAGWDHARVREVCDSGRFNPGLCRLRWPYFLAIVLTADQLCLALLGFVLTCKQPQPLPVDYQWHFAEHFDTVTRLPKRRSSVAGSQYSINSNRNLQL